MKRWAKIEEFYAFRKVTFYTIRFEDEDISETDKFLYTFSENTKEQDKVNRLVAFLEIMGLETGAKKDFFRPENNAEALPPEYHQSRKYGLVEFLDYDLRLYCMRLSDSVVILFNGGVKVSQKVQDSPSLFPKFRQAQILSSKIDQLIRNKEIIVTDHLIIGDDLTFEF